MSTLYQSSKDVPTEVLSARLNQLSHVVSSNRERIDAEFTMRIPAEVDRDADLVMSEAAVRLEALQAECEKLRKGLNAVQELIDNSYGVAGLHLNGDIAPWCSLREGGHFEEWMIDFDAAIQELSNAND